MTGVKKKPRLTGHALNAELKRLADIDRLAAAEQFMLIKRAEKIGRARQTTHAEIRRLQTEASKLA